jgi:aromatic ring-opening dioxygenase catalytic subunit (LigB family)
MAPIVALSEVPRAGRDCVRFADGIRAYGDILRVQGIVLVSTHWARLSDSPSVIVEIGDQSEPAAFALAHQTAALLQRSGLSTEFGGGSARDNAVWVALLKAHDDADVPLVHIGVPARFGSELMTLTARALEPLRNDKVLLVGLNAAFGEALRRDLAPANILLEGVTP